MRRLLVPYLAADALGLASSAAAFHAIAPQSPPHSAVRQLSGITSAKQSASGPMAYPTLAISDANLPGLPELRSQDQQIQAALPLGGTVQGTKWRVREERNPAFFGDGRTKDTTYCTSTVLFEGIAGDTNRGTVEYDPGTCAAGDTLEAGGSSNVYGKTKGLRWVSKTTRVIQLTARWKVRLPEGKFIYKGYIDGGRRRQMEGKSGQNNVEMTGTILTGDDDATIRVVGKFTADLIKTIE